MILDLFLIGLVVTLEPIPLSAMILLLAAERGLLKGLGFVLGWLGTLVIIVAVVVVVTGGKPLIPKSNPSTAALVVKLMAGAILVAIAARRRARIARASSSDAPKEKKQPKWMTRLDQVNPLVAAGLGFFLQPWVLVAAGVTTIVEGKLDTSIEYLAVFGFAVWCSASYLAARDVRSAPARGGEGPTADTARLDQFAHRPGDRDPVPLSRPLPDGEGHLRVGLGLTGPETPASAQAVGAAGGGVGAAGAAAAGALAASIGRFGRGGNTDGPRLAWIIRTMADATMM